MACGHTSILQFEIYNLHFVLTVAVNPRVHFFLSSCSLFMASSGVMLSRFRSAIFFEEQPASLAKPQLRFRPRG
jgi:hypothetical protein